MRTNWQGSVELGWLDLLATICTQEVRGQTFFPPRLGAHGVLTTLPMFIPPLMFCRIVLSVTVAVRDKQRCTTGCHMRPPPSLPQSANLFSLRWSWGLEISRNFPPPGCLGPCLRVLFHLISHSDAKYLNVVFLSDPFSSSGRHISAPFRKKVCLFWKIAELVH